ncbi:tRNA modification GTPase [Singulisphaera sp. PoT]|uniref:tRNA modification GTPase n=1 Tax=Singulisphaera sp. PoT TaxID=3411797 RepID=UPI003BF4CAD0
MSSRLDPHDTIAAVASPPGPGFRGLVRLSGPEAWSIALGRFTPDIDAPPPRRAERRTGRLAVAGLRPPLPAAIVLWPAPRTYTGQQLAEIHTVGSPPLVNLLLADCLTRGARLAEPGEFTLRAFLSGRIDLTRAEAVLGVIDARSPAQLDAALQQLAGGLSGPITEARDHLLDVLAHLEANLDFAEEPDVDVLARAELANQLSSSSEQFAALAARLVSRERPEGHPRVVLVGPPNAGKSLLFNALLGQTRALVSPQAGTTRDYLSALCDCDGLTIELIDTAGIEPGLTPIEARAQALRDAQAAQADLLLDCRPSDSAFDPALSLLVGTDRPRLEVWTKSDLETLEDDQVSRLSTSARTGAGLPALRHAIATTLRDTDAEGSLATSTGARCRESLELASRALESASQAILLGAGDELVAVDLRQAIDELGKVVGVVVTDDILDRIFRRFCIGK